MVHKTSPRRIGLRWAVLGIVVYAGYEACELLRLFPDFLGFICFAFAFSGVTTCVLLVSTAWVVRRSGVIGRKKNGRTLGLACLLNHDFSS